MDAHSDTQPLVLVVGSGGFLGTRVAAALSLAYRVVGLDSRPPEPRLHSKWIACDFTAPASIAHALATLRHQYGARITSVIHLVAAPEESEIPPSLSPPVLVKGTAQLLDELQASQVEQYVFCSSLQVLRPAQAREVLTEFSPAAATKEDARALLEAEQMVQQARGPLSTVILRIGHVYDEDCHCHLLAHYISHIHRKQLDSYVFPGDPTHGQAFVHVADFCACVRQTLMLRRALTPQELFLIAEPDLVTYGELLDQLGTLIHGHVWPTLPIPKSMAKVTAWVHAHLTGGASTWFRTPEMVERADVHYPVAITRARTRLGWEPQHALRETLEEMVRGLLQDPQRWYRTNGLSLKGNAEHTGPGTP